MVRSFIPADQQDSARKSLWSGLNLLVVGPPGCGKLSMISVLGKALNPAIQLTVYDLETEPETQTQTLAHFAEHYCSRRGQGVAQEGLILRHLHRLSQERVRRFLEICADVNNRTSDGPEDVPPKLYATSHEETGWSDDLRADFSAVFPCQIHLAGAPSMKRDVSRFVLDVLADLNRRYGKRITEVESGVFDAVQRQAGWWSSLHELRSIVERAYFREDTQRLSIRSIEAA
jgi:energy-coupling factor transporter ATP-binding protein EcfA2